VTQAGERRSGAVEAMRGLASLGVVEAHVWLFARAPFNPVASFRSQLLYAGGLGLVVFFSLSGYLLFRAFARQYFAAGRRVSLRGYALNRVLRIAPLYAVVMVVLVVLTQHGGTPLQWLRFATFTQGFFPDTVATVDGPAWSLAVEAHYYLLLPLLAWLVALISRGTLLGAAAVLLAIMLAGVAARLLLVIDSQTPTDMARYNLPTNVQYFIPGMLLALLEIAWAAGRPAWLAGYLGRSDIWFLGALACWLVAQRFPGNDAFLLVGSFLAVGGCALGVLHAGVVRHALEFRPLVLLGLLSYGIFLWHLPLLDWLYRHTGVPHGFLLLLAATLVLVLPLATLTYRFVESPFLRMRRAWA
jgi:peptidoglycan/LPS O-acetylase OafA/YrhL